MTLLRPIHHTFAPLGNGKQCRLALQLLLHKTQREGHASVDLLRTELSRRLGGTTCLFGSGREALLAFLASCPFAPGDEIIVQAYTCVVVPNAIHAAGLVPVFADIRKETLNIDPSDAERRITPKTRAIICQHTFGIPAPLQELRALCDAHGLLLIEDCAHVLPDAEGPMEVTSAGDALLLSFGRDKAVSGITGGAVVCRRPEIGAKIFQREQTASPLPDSTVRRLLLYPLLYAVARPLYGTGVGRAFLLIMRRLRLLLPIVSSAEKHGEQGPSLHALPEACAKLAMQQFQQLPVFNAHRRTLVRTYLEACAQHGWPVLHGIRPDLPLQKFPLFTKHARHIRSMLKRKNMHVDDGWTGCVLCPASIELDEETYRRGSDPMAEEACEEILSLPTHPGTSEADAERLIAVLTLLLQPGAGTSHPR